jgi:predicted GNAT family acetyltransferase
VLGDSEGDDIQALLDASSPRHDAKVGAPEVIAWYGVRDDDDGRLVACAAHTEPVPGVPHLASIATRPAARGRGLGAAVTAAVTRAPLEAGRPVVTLGMYSDNAVARRLYHRLGYTCTHRWSSRRLRRPAGSNLGS